MLTAEWVKTFGISTSLTPETTTDSAEAPVLSAEAIAKRTLILQGVVAVGAGVAAEPVISWFKAQGLWDQLTAEEIAFLSADEREEKDCLKQYWHKEALWTLLWVISKVDHLGLPIAECDSAALVDRIMPKLGGDCSEFIESAILRSSAMILAEDDRTYDIWCRSHQTTDLPDDLHMRVLYERRYAMEWLDGTQPWDEVTCDT